jgi:hypothetical protein
MAGTQTLGTLGSLHFPLISTNDNPQLSTSNTELISPS